MTNIGITGGGNNTHMIYIDGKKDHIVKEKDLAPYLEDIIRKKKYEISLRKLQRANRYDDTVEDHSATRATATPRAALTTQRPPRLLPVVAVAVTPKSFNKKFEFPGRDQMECENACTTT